MAELLANLSGGKYFSKLDMSQAYLQLPLDEESKELVTVNIHKGLYRYNRLPFGVSSAPSIFQRTMENLLQGVKNVSVYIDDIVITGASTEEHLQTLDVVLEKLETAGLKLNRSKCFFLRPSIEYLGHIIDKDGLHPTREKVQAIQEAQNQEILVSYDPSLESSIIITSSCQVYRKSWHPFTSCYVRTCIGLGEESRTKLSKPRNNLFKMTRYFCTTTNQNP